MSIAQTIKERRTKLKVSQIDLAEISDVSIATIKNIERGKGNPSLETMEKIADALGMELTLQIRKMI